MCHPWGSATSSVPVPVWRVCAEGAGQAAHVQVDLARFQGRDRQHHPVLYPDVGEPQPDSLAEQRGQVHHRLCRTRRLSQGVSLERRRPVLESDGLNNGNVR